MDNSVLVSCFKLNIHTDDLSLLWTRCDTWRILDALLINHLMDADDSIIFFVYIVLVNNYQEFVHNVGLNPHI